MSARTGLRWLFVALCVVATTRSEAAAGDAPPAKPATTVHGIPVVVAERGLHETETIGLAFEFGTDSAVQGKLGSVGLAVDVVLEGRRASGKSLKAQLDERGVTIRISPGMDRTFVLIECLPGDVEWAVSTAFGALAEQLVVEPKEFEQLKQTRLARLKGDRTAGPNRGLYYALQYLVDGDRLTRKWAAIEQENIGLVPEDVLPWIHAFAPTRASFIGGAGPLPKASVISAISKSLGDTKAESSPGPAPKADSPTTTPSKTGHAGIILIDAPNGPVQVVVAARATHRSNSERMLLQLMCNAKGEFVRQVWVEKEHRAWWANVSLSPWRDMDIAYAVATVSAKGLDKFVDDLTHLVVDPREGVSIEELTRAATRLAVQQYTALFGSAGTVNAMLAAEPPSDPLKFLAESHVTDAQLASVWSALDSGTVTLVVGPLATTKAALSGREVEVYVP